MLPSEVPELPDTQPEKSRLSRNMRMYCFKDRVITRITVGSVVPTHRDSYDGRVIIAVALAGGNENISTLFLFGQAG
jgi:hypothetical protein